MKKFTIYYINKNGDRIAVYQLDDYEKALDFVGDLQELNEKHGGDVQWHMISNTNETVLF